MSTECISHQVHTSAMGPDHRLSFSIYNLVHDISLSKTLKVSIWKHVLQKGQIDFKQGLKQFFIMYLVLDIWEQMIRLINEIEWRRRRLNAHAEVQGVSGKWRHMIFFYFLKISSSICSWYSNQPRGVVLVIFSILDAKYLLTLKDLNDFGVT